MKTVLIETLREQSNEIAIEGIDGWGNTMLFAAEALEANQAELTALREELELLRKDVASNEINLNASSDLITQLRTQIKQSRAVAPQVVSDELSKLDKGPFSVMSEGFISSNDFTIDAALRVTGDFESAEQKQQYCEAICQRLNATRPDAAQEAKDDRLETALGALADIATNDDMTRGQQQAKAKRIYWELRGDASQEGK